MLTPAAKATVSGWTWSSSILLMMLPHSSLTLWTLVDTKVGDVLVGSQRPGSVRGRSWEKALWWAMMLLSKYIYKNQVAVMSLWLWVNQPDNQLITYPSFNGYGLMTTTTHLHAVGLRLKAWPMMHQELGPVLCWRAFGLQHHHLSSARRICRGTDNSTIYWSRNTEDLPEYEMQWQMVHQRIYSGG